MAEVKINEPTNEIDITDLLDSVDLVTRPQKKNPDKTWTGIRIKFQDDMTFYVFPYPSQLKKINQHLSE